MNEKQYQMYIQSLKGRAKENAEIAEGTQTSSRFTPDTYDKITLAQTILENINNIYMPQATRERLKIGLRLHIHDQKSVNKTNVWENRAINALENPSKLKERKRIIKSSKREIEKIDAQAEKERTAIERTKDPQGRKIGKYLSHVESMVNTHLALLMKSFKTTSDFANFTPTEESLQPLLEDMAKLDTAIANTPIKEEVEYDFFA